MAVKRAWLSLAAIFFTLALVALLVSGPGVRTARAQCCYLPDNEQAFGVGEGSGLDAGIYLFQMHIWDSAYSSGSMNDQLVDEAPGGNVADGCWWNGNTYFAAYPAFNSEWTVGENEEAGNTNYWGYDAMGFTIAQVGYIQKYGPAHSVSFPCTMTAYQAMSIEECDGNTYYCYDCSRGNLITFTVYKSDSDPDQLICRTEGISPLNKVCGEID